MPESGANCEGHMLLTLSTKFQANCSPLSGSALPALYRMAVGRRMYSMTRPPRVEPVLMRELGS